MTVTKIKNEYILANIKDCLAVFQRTNRKELCSELDSLEEAVLQKGSSNGYAITAEEDEIDLLMPYIRMLARDQIMLSLVVLGGNLSIGAISLLEPIARVSAKCAVAPVSKGRCPICVMILPLKQSFQDMLALDAVAASVFTNRR